MDRDDKRRLVEALVMASPEPISAARLAAVVPYGTPAVMSEMVTELNALYAESERAFRIDEVAGGYQMRTLGEFSPYLQQLHAQRPARLSRAALETLAIIAYRQPVTRAEVEEVRGVDVGAVLRSLVERKLVRIAGHREVPGRPMLYATSKRFLEVFGLASLRDLPTLREIEELLGADEGVEASRPSAEAADDAEAGRAYQASPALDDAGDVGPDDDEAVAAPPPTTH